MKANLNGVEFRLAIQDAGHKICSALGLKPVTFYWKAGATTAAINSSGDVQLPNIDDGETVHRSTFARYAGYVLHELLHRKYTNFAAGRSEPVQYIRQLHNAIEDIWIERRCIQEGIAGNSEQLLTGLINGVIDDVPANLNWADPRQYPFALACYGRHYAKPVPIAEGLEPIFAKASSMIDTAADSYDTYDIAKWVWKQLANLDDEQSDAPKGEQTDGQPGAPADEDGDGSETDQNGAGDANEDGEGGDEGDDKKSPGKASAPTNETKAREVEPQLKSQKSKTGSYDREAFMCNLSDHLFYSPRYAMVDVAGGRLQYEVKRLFENSGTDDFMPNLRKGRIDHNNLHTLRSGNDRVFKRRREVAGIDSAVVVLIDVSGSMGSCLGMTASTAKALITSLEKAGVKVAVVTFGTSFSVLKPFESPSIRRHLDDLSRLGDGGGTNDYHALRFAHELLAMRPEQRKVVFSLTDGYGDVQSSVAQIEQGNRLGITTVGVGILDDVSGVYKNSIHVTSMDDLATASFKQIKLAA